MNKAKGAKYLLTLWTLLDSTDIREAVIEFLSCYSSIPKLRLAPKNFPGFTHVFSKCSNFEVADTCCL